MKHTLVTTLFLFIFYAFLLAQSPTDKENYKLIEAALEKETYGEYKKPPTLLKLEAMKGLENYNTDYIGFLVRFTERYHATPVDIIPFAATGGDGCHFAFLTDFGNCQDLEFAPIVFISPTDFDQNRPKNTSKLFAKNIKDFLRIMITMQYAENIRAKNVLEIDFEEQIEIIKLDRKEDDPKYERTRKATIDAIKKEFNIEEIKNLNAYYTGFIMGRNTENYIQTKDGLNIKKNSNTSEEEEKIDFAANLNNIDSTLAKANPHQRLQFYRDAPFYFFYLTKEYAALMEIVGKYLLLDGCKREYNLWKSEQSIITSFINENEIRLKKN
jgi:hypothetical protein